MPQAAPSSEPRRVATLSRAQFVCECLKRQRPVIIAGEAASWPAVAKWSLDYLGATHEDHDVLVEYYPTGNRSNAYTYVRMTVGEYVRKVSDDPTARSSYYIADTTLESTLPQLVNDVSPPNVIENRDSLRTGLFFGHDTFSAAHYHRYNVQAMLCQVVGEKEVVLYPAEDMKHTYLHPWYGLRPNFSRMELEFENHRGCAQQYPKLSRAQRYHCTLRPGEMLFIPDHWVHSVAGRGENVSITYFWNEPWRYAYLPGVLRDYAAQANKSAMVGTARIGRMLGVHGAMVSLAARIGIIPEEEREAVLRHIEEFDGQLPASINAEQATHQLHKVG